MDAKKIAAEKAATYVQDDMLVGLGTGSTVFFAIQKLGEMVKQGLRIRTVSSSLQSEKIAAELNIPTITFAEIQGIDIYIDGADEIDKNQFLIKGGGGALLREKILAFNSKRFIVIADESKMVDTLGKFPLPVEIVDFAVEFTVANLSESGAKVKIRQKDGSNYISDNGNLVADCLFDSIPDPAFLNEKLHQIPGVVETGIFLNSMVSQVVIGYKDGNIKEMKGR